MHRQELTKKQTGMISVARTKKTVRDDLLLIQNFRCAYCERKLHDANDEDEDKWDGHIEHFRRKDLYFHPELTFIWENLFYSCTTGATCGRYKDGYITKKEQYHLLINPCEDNPEDFFVFDNSGRVLPCSGITDQDKARAEFTIKTFQLNEPKLRLKRKEMQKKYDWLKKYSLQDIDIYLNSVQSEPFITAIFHYFGKRVVS